jgi:hypothetical protein
MTEQSCDNCVLFHTDCTGHLQKNSPCGDYRRKRVAPVYQFQCMRCFIMSGIVSVDSEDAPLCCGGEQMTAIPMASTQEATK